MKSQIVLCALILLSGCATDEYDLIQPPALARQISAAPTTAPDDPLVYQFQTVESRLVISIQNPTTQPIVLIGERSFIVSPDGQSHPVLGQSIAPGSYIKLILPPMRPWSNESDEFMAAQPGSDIDHLGADMVYPASSHYDTEAPGDPTFFQWEGETDLRMSLAFESGGESFVHSFLFHRKKTG